MATPVSFDPGTWNSSVEAPFTLGARYSYLGREFIYVRNANTAGDNAVEDGDCCVWAATAVSGTTRNAGVVSDGLAGTGSSLPLNPPAGVAVGAITKNYYGFLLAKGDHTNAKSTSSSAGVEQKISATAGTCTDQTAATIKSFGVCLVATSGSRCTLRVDL